MQSAAEAESGCRTSSISPGAFGEPTALCASQQQELPVGLMVHFSYSLGNPRDCAEVVEGLCLRSESFFRTMEVVALLTRKHNGKPIRQRLRCPLMS
jgi:hypothetical protein